GEARLGYGFLLRESARTATRIPAVRSMLVLSAAITALTFGPMIFMQPFLAGHGVEVSFLGIIQSPVRLVAMAGALLAAWTTLRLGTRGAFAAAPLLIAGSYLLLGVWDSTYAFLAFPLIAGANSLLLVPATDYLNQRIPSNQRATILSLRTMLVSFGAALLEPGLGVVADTISVKAVFWVTAAVAAVLLPLALGLWIRADLGEERPAASDAVRAPP
ncbi:MAG: hypothetical protein Q8S13_07105, partial [Dehalococcoidia bacterium]|nr:hypothetical protein [Dehalococcoidia bacterium]